MTERLRSRACGFRDIVDLNELNELNERGDEGESDGEGGANRAGNGRSAASVPWKDGRDGKWGGKSETGEVGDSGGERTGLRKMEGREGGGLYVMPIAEWNPFGSLFWGMRHTVTSPWSPPK